MLDPKLYSLLAVEATGNFTRAAEQLSLTQPAVSQHVRALEQELGCEIHTSPLTQYNGALGAALFAWQKASRDAK